MTAIAALRELEADKLRDLVEKSNYFRPKVPIVKLSKGSDEYAKGLYNAGRPA